MPKQPYEPFSNVKPLDEYVAENPEIKLGEDGHIKLTYTQINKLKDAYENSDPKKPFGIPDMSFAVFGKRYHPASYPCKAIVKTIKVLGIEARGGKKEPFQLTDAQKLYIKTHAGSEDMNLLEVVKDACEKKDLAINSREYRAALEYLKSLPENPLVSRENLTASFRAINSYPAAMSRVNQAAGSQIIQMGSWKTNSRIKTYLDSLISFCSSPRFVLLAKTYIDKTERDLFINTFVSYVWDKPDLTQEDLGLYIDVCYDIVSEFIMNKQINYFNQLVETKVDETDGKLSMAYVEQINNLTKNINDNKKRRSQIIEKLQGARKDRIESRSKEHDSLLYLVDYIKQTQNREFLMKGLAARKLNLENEVKRIESLPDLIMEIYGVGKEEIVNAPIA